VRADGDHLADGKARRTVGEHRPDRRGKRAVGLVTPEEVERRRGLSKHIAPGGIPPRELGDDLLTVRTDRQHHLVRQLARSIGLRARIDVRRVPRDGRRELEPLAARHDVLAHELDEPARRKPIAQRHHDLAEVDGPRPGSMQLGRRRRGCHRGRQRSHRPSSFAALR
jgi:hypothetical protein